MHEERPLGVVARRDRLGQVLRRVAVVGAADEHGLVLEQALDAFLGFLGCCCVVWVLCEGFVVVFCCCFEVCNAGVETAFCARVVCVRRGVWALCAA